MDEGAVDASALLAAILGEPGAEVVGALIGRAMISTVNLAEVVTKLTERGIPGAEVRQLVNEFRLAVVPLDDDQAYTAGFLRTATRHLGLSLGDRACLALGIARSVPVITAERRWNQLDLPVDVILIR
jgi:PIN domain nuclease of toxin-antitoxin system